MVGREADRPLGGLEAGEFADERRDHRRAHRIEAAMVLEGGVADERPILAEAGHAIDQRLLGLGRRGADKGAQMRERGPLVRVEGGEIGVDGRDVPGVGHGSGPRRQALEIGAALASV